MKRREFVKLGAAILGGAKTGQSEASDRDVSSRSFSHSDRGTDGFSASAHWIWPSSLDGFEPNTFVYFRHRFELDAVPKQDVWVKVSASTQYILYVNGNYVGFGPPITDPRRHYFDIRRMSPYLRKGRNVIAARVYSLATATEDSVRERGRFILEGGIGSGPHRVTLDSDTRWKCLVSEVWLRNAPRQSPQLHYVEIADFRKEPVGWKGQAFDDSEWPRAFEMGYPESGAGQIVRRELGEIKETFRPVSSVVRSTEVERKNGFTIPARQVQAEHFIPEQTVRFANLSSLETNSPAASVVTPVNGRDAAIVFDMGKMVLGCPFFEAEGTAGAVVDVSISEYLKDGRVFASRPISATWRTNLTDRITVGEGKTAWKRNDYNGYRYIQLTIRDAKKPLVLRRVGTVLREYDFHKEAAFRSSNSTLDRIFDSSKWSHRVNTHWGYCGSAWREHAQWSDLIWPAMNLAVFHDPPAMRYYLRQIVLGQNVQGRMQFPHPGSEGTELPEQTMWLADGLWKCALYFNDRDLVHDLLPAMVKANDWFKKHTTPAGLISTKDWPKMWLVIDWGYPYVNDPEPGELATLNLIYYNFLSSVEQCAGYDGNEEIRANFRHQGESLKETINKVFWMPEPGMYVEKPNEQFPSSFASVLALKYGVAPEEHLQQVFDIAVGPALRPGKASPWFMYSVLEAFARAGRFKDAVSSICRYWGTFLEADATTYWELWNIPGENVYPLRGTTQEAVARTITYSSGPAAYVVNHILGVQPLEPGFRKALIAPHPSGLDSFEGKAPTPRGDVHVAWRRPATGESTEFYVNVPEGVEATLKLPYSESEPYVSLNNQPFFDGKGFKPNPRIANPAVTSGSLTCEIMRGYYYFRASAS